MAIPLSGDELRKCDCSEKKIPNWWSIKNPYILDTKAVKNIKNHKQLHIFVQSQTEAILLNRHSRTIPNSLLGHPEPSLVLIVTNLIEQAGTG